MKRDQPVRGVLRPADIRRLVVFSVVLLVVVPVSAWFAGGFDRWPGASWQPGFHADVFTAAPLATRLHAIAILVLVVSGWIVLALPKGNARHRLLGWTWVSGMALMGGTSLAVPHGDSWVAAYFGGGSALVLLAFGVFFVKRGQLRHHARTMSMLMIALVLMTLLSLLPGRLMHDVFFGEPAAAEVPAAIAPVQAFPDPTRFESAIAQFEAQDQIQRPPEGAIVLTGSSSIARWNDQASAALAPLTVIPRGFGGSVMHDVLHYLDRVALVYKPRAILIYEGDNDTGGSPPISNEAILADLKQIIARIHAALPQTRIYVLSIKPSVLRRATWPIAQQVNAGYQQIAAQDPLVHYVDVASALLGPDGNVMTDIFVEDNLHLNDKGNAIWGAAIKAALMPLEAQAE